MSAIRDSSATFRAIAGITIRDGGGVLRSIKQAFLRDGGGVLRTVFNSLTGTVTPGYVEAYGASTGALTLVTTAATASPDGAAYSWALISSFGFATWTVVNPTAQTTSFRAAGVVENQSAQALFRCTVTIGGVSVVSNDVTAYAENYGSPYL